MTMSSSPFIDDSIVLIGCRALAYAVPSKTGTRKPGRRKLTTNLALLNVATTTGFDRAGNITAYSYASTRLTSSVPVFGTSSMRPKSIFG